ncbi:threonylcarbamoyl-AMP synthase [Corticibacter populi]|uniref:Threonylcarbamoyl-AMP synthase n=1 Tax=Corticibacter populi TaxID=1550736 RepID=A0A3M6QP23_9BURK|nr:L-threonylcarbamoyladenylate synthase [Corticibacter populi]RMX04804.1 threonylcarbamoyl-AMP synthase [Corticibacter populi]RZS33783.1 translation factor SUA5 [Corticibacter populi]
MILLPDSHAMAAAVQALQQGQLLGLPTETVYGLAADAENGAAVARIYERKGRPSDHPLIVHVPDVAAAQHFAADIPPFALALMQAFWPGPLTLILPRRPGAAESAAAGQATIGLRSPSHPVARQLMLAALQAEPPVRGIAAPSANRFGRVSPTSAAHVAAEFGDDLLVLDGGDCEVGIESTIVDCSRGRPVILRPGHIAAAAIAQACGLPVDVHGATGPGEHALIDDAEDDTPRAPGTLTAHYAPNAKVRLMDAASLQAGLDVLGAQARHIAVYSRTPMKSASRELVLRRMPAQPEQVAHELFRLLREFDGLGVRLIWIEELPAGSAWDGVRDRLNRAAASA